MQRPPKTIFWCILAGLVLLLVAVPALAQQTSPGLPAGVQAYLLGLPAVSQWANRKAILEMGPANTTVPIFENS